MTSKLFSSCSVWAWRKPGINSWLRAEPTQAEIPKKGQKRGPKKVKKHPLAGILAQIPKKRPKKGPGDPPENLKKSKKGQKTRKNDPIPFLKGRYAKTP